MSLAHDWGPHGITVNCLAPGWFKTAQNRVLYEDPGWVEYLCERIPLGRPGEPSDLDGALLLLASDASRYITGQTLLVDGGISVGGAAGAAEVRTRNGASPPTNRSASQSIHTRLGDRVAFEVGDDERLALLLRERRAVAASLPTELLRSRDRARARGRA